MDIKVAKLTFKMLDRLECFLRDKNKYLNASGLHTFNVKLGEAIEELYKNEFSADGYIKEIEGKKCYVVELE